MKVIPLILLVIMATETNAQERVARPDAKPAYVGAAWTTVPEVMRQSIKFPNWPMPTNVRDWEKNGRAATRQTLISLLGDKPPRPDPAKVRVVSKEDKGDFSLERFEFHNGVDSVVPGVLLIPKAAKFPAPAVITMHHYGSNKQFVALDAANGDNCGMALVKAGFIVAAIDGYFHGDRVGTGPAGKAASASQQEQDLFKLNFWLGRNLWGMMVRDQQCLLDYLVTRPDVDAKRIGATGMSMGCTSAYWLAALDDRVAAIAGTACFTRYEQLIALGDMKAHGVYYYVPGVLKQFDTEAIHALIAPRPHLEQTGDADPTAPADGIAVLEGKLGALYKLYGKNENFRSVVYQNTGHEYLPEEKAAMVAWFEKHLGKN